MSKKLTNKQQRFIEEYLIDLNATQAAIRAGYSEKTAKEQGHRLLTNVHIAKAIAKGKAERSEKTKIDSNWLLERLVAEATADIADIYEESGSLKPIHDWPMIWRTGLVSGLDVHQEYKYVDGKKIPDGVTTKIKISDRIKRLELIGKHIGVQAFNEKHEHTGPEGAPLYSDLELARRLAHMLTRGLNDKPG